MYFRVLKYKISCHFLAILIILLNAYFEAILQVFYDH
jgi:hypothetical protein